MLQRGQNTLINLEFWRTRSVDACRGHARGKFEKNATETPQNINKRCTNMRIKESINAMDNEDTDITRQ